MHKESITVSRKYILLPDADGYVVVDTGSPLSYHQSGRLSFGESDHVCSTSILGVSGEALSRELNRHVVGLLGMDIMGRCESVLFNYRGGQIIVNGWFKRGNGALQTPPGGHVPLHR